MKSIKLNDQVSLPVLGFGVWQLSPEECQQSVEEAFKVGYRHIDTADAYGNHHAVAAAIKSSGLKREDFFITTKVRQNNQGKSGVEESVDRFLEELGIEYIDLLLIHWPNRDFSIEETLKALGAAKNAGKIRAIGVSNFNEAHLKEALAVGVEIVNNQVELHPTFQQKEMRAFLKEHNMTITSYSTNGRGQDLELPEIKEIAEKYGKTPYQIILNWAVSQDIIVIPRSSKLERVKENFEIFDFELSSEDLEKINNIEQKPRLSEPAFADFDYTS